jgi:NlpC/P60 family protein
MSHWAREFIGKQWAADGDGPDRFSCWNLVRHALRRRGVDLPVMPVEALRGACAVEDARDGDVVLMRNGIGEPHCGLLVAANGRLGVLHAHHGAGVVWEAFGQAVAGMRHQVWRPTALVRKGDAIEWHGAPQDKEDFRSILQIAAVVASFFPGPWTPWIIAANVAYNLLVPPSQPRRPDQPIQGDVFSTGLSGNEARLDQPIWKVCGRREITPPFACQPYSEFRPKDGEPDPTKDNDQYFNCLFAVGVGNHDVVAKIANTPITRFADVLTAQYLAPGVQPSSVLANVTTASEVSSQVMDSGLYVGGFSACAPNRTCSAIGIDVIATRGLGKTAALTVTWRVEYRPINDFGQVLGSWAVLGTESRTGFTATQQRWSSRYELGTAARVEVRVVRTDSQDTDPSASHEIAWTGLRAYLAEPATLNEHTAHYEVVMRASNQLSNIASRDVRLIVMAYARTWTPGDTTDDGWQAEEHTRNPAWWLLDLASSDTWGIDKPDDRIDLQSFYDLAQICDARQDRFDHVFDSTMNAWDAMQLIARSCRARVFRRNGVLSVARDELADLPVTAFTPRNCQPGMAISEKLRNRKSPDGYIIEYQDHRTWEWTPIECPCPGVVTMTNPVIQRLPGVVGATHAEREGLYEAANLLYRPRIAAWTTEMQGLLPAYMSPVDFLPDIVGYGSSGDVAFWTEATLTMGLSEAPDFSVGPLYLTLIRDDGTLTDAVLVAPGPTEFDVVLPALPDFQIILDDGTRERPKYLIGAKDLVKVVAITDGGKTDEGAQLYNLTGVIDDDRVHAADVHLLPGPGDIQDPVGLPDDSDEGGGRLLIVQISDQTAVGVSNSSTARAEYTLHNNGQARIEYEGANSGSASDIIPGQWLMAHPVEVANAALFESRATLLAGAVLSGDLDTWQNLGTDRVWDVEGTFSGGSGYALLLIEIREISTGIVQDSARISLTATFNL